MRTTVALGALLALGLAATFACTSQPDTSTNEIPTPVGTPTGTPQPAATPIETIRVERGSYDRTLKADGQLVPAETGKVFSRKAGTLGSLTVSVGDQVKQGDVVGKVQISGEAPDTRLAEFRLASARERLALLGQPTPGPVPALPEFPQATPAAPVQPTPIETPSVPTPEPGKALDLDLKIADLEKKVADAKTKNFDFELADAKREYDMTANRMKDLRVFAQAIAWKNNPESWDATGKADDAERNFVKAKDKYDSLVASAGTRQDDTARLEEQLQLAKQLKAQALQDAAQYPQRVAQAQATYQARQAKAQDDYTKAVARYDEDHANAADLAAARVKVEEARANAEGLRSANAQAANDVAVNAAQREIEIANHELALAQDEAAKIAAGITLIAPLSGVVTSLANQEGDLVNAFTPILTIVDPADARVTAALPETEVTRVTIGQAAKVSIPAIGVTDADGQIERILPTSESTKVNDQTVPSYRVSIKVPGLSPDARLGMTAQVQIILETLKDQFRVPSTAIYTVGGTSYVDRVTANGPEQTAVQVGQTYDDQIVITSGLQEGDEIAVRPARQVRVGR